MNISEINEICINALKMLNAYYSVGKNENVQDTIVVGDNMGEQEKVVHRYKMGVHDKIIMKDNADVGYVG